MKPALDPETHFKRLTALLRLEEEEEEAEFREEILKRTAEEREQAGNALLHLTLMDSHYNPAGHRLLTFRYDDGSPLPVYSLDTGDVVILSEESDLSRNPVGGTVYDKEAKEITVAYSRELPEWVNDHGLYRLNVSTNKTTYKRMAEALGCVLAAENSRLASLRSVLLGLRKPLLGDPVPCDKREFLNPSLNDSQKKAVAVALEALDVALVHGPPGTGKTTVLVEIIRQARREGKALLVTAPSNAACDHLVACIAAAGEIVLRLGHPARMAKHLRDYSLDFKLANHPYARQVEELEAELNHLLKRRDRHRERRVFSRDKREEIRDEAQELRKEIRIIEGEIFSQIWNETDIVVATHTGAGDPLLVRKNFDWVIMDEATQAIEPNSWIPVLHAKKVILAGDHWQLPPTVRSREAGEKGLGVTMFERLQEILGEESKALLTVQYRMHEKIMAFSSGMFYEKKLVAHPSVKAHVLADLEGVRRVPETEEPFLFLDTAGKGFEEQLESGSESRYNPEEAGLVIQEFEKLCAAGVSPGDIAVISPYSAQVKLIASKIQNPSVEIDSVDAFQGREKEAVIVSLVRSNLEGRLGFLTDVRRMNVAMTRARRRLTVIGDSSTLSAIPFYKDFIQYAEAIGGCRSAWEYV